MKLLLKAIKNTSRAEGTYTEVELYRREDDTLLLLTIDECHRTNADQFPYGYDFGLFLDEFLEFDEIESINFGFISEMYNDLYAEETDKFYDFAKKFDLFQFIF